MTIEIAFPILAFLAIRLMKFGLRDWRQVLSKEQGLTSVLWTAILSMALVLVIFIGVIPFVVYRYHQDLVRSKDELATEVIALKSQLNSAGLQNKSLIEKNRVVAGQLLARGDPANKITVSPGAAYSTHQMGGITAGTVINTGLPPLVMTAAEEEVVSDKSGLRKTLVTVIPNVPVSAPTGIAVDFDNPILDIHFTIIGASIVLGGGPFRVGTHAYISIGSGFDHDHPAMLTVYSKLPVKVIRPPVLESQPPPRPS